MLVARDGGKMTVLTHQGKNLPLWHYPLDKYKLLIDLIMLYTTPCHILILHFTLANMQSLNTELMFPFLISAIIISFTARLTFTYRWNQPVIYGITAKPALKYFENLSTDGKVELLNKTLFNIFRNNIPNKKIKCDFSSGESYHDKVLEKSAECT